MRLGVITDAHVSLRPGDSDRFNGAYDLVGSAARLERAVESLREEAVELIVMTGDLAHHGDAASIERALEALATAPVPVYVLPGNHDSVDPGALSAALAARAPANIQLVSHAGTAIAPGVRLAGRPDQPSDTDYRTLPEDVAAWGDDVVVWAAHFPPLSLAALCADAGLRYAGDAADIEEARVRLTARTAPTIALTGHLHVRGATADGTLLQLAAAALVEAPRDVAVVELELEPAVAVRRRVITSEGGAPGKPLPVFSPAEVRFELTADGWVSRRVLRARHAG